MKKLRWQIVLVVIALVAIAALIFGNNPISRAVVQEATQGGVYTEGLVGTPSRFNPLLDYYNPIDRDIDRLLFSRMIVFDSYGKPTPDLAVSWGVNVKGDIFNITLRQDVLWHDGKQVTTQDVLFTIELMRSPEVPLPPDIIALWNSVEVEAFDDYNLQIRLTEPYSPFIDYLSFGILPKHLFEDKTIQQIIDDPINLSPVGSGPFVLDEVVTEDGRILEVLLEANEDYYFGRPNLDQIVFRYYSSTAEALTAYQNNQIQGINSIDHDSLQEVLNEPTLNVYTARLPQMSIILLNLDNGQVPFFQDSQIRQGLLQALNRQWMIDQALQGQALIAHSPILPGTWAFYDQIDTYPFDSTLAVDKFINAGYILSSVGGAARTNEEGAALSFDLVYPDSSKFQSIADMIQQDWANVGVEVNLIPVDFETLMTAYLEPRQYQAALVDLSMFATPDPDPYPFWHQSQINVGQNYSKWNDRRASEYLERARTTPNMDERQRLYRNFQIHFSRELPALPLFFPVYNFAVAEEIRGIRVGPLFDSSDRFLTIIDWFILSRPGVQDVLVPTEEGQ